MHEEFLYTWFFVISVLLFSRSGYSRHSLDSTFTFAILLSCLWLLSRHESRAKWASMKEPDFRNYFLSSTVVSFYLLWNAWKLFFLGLSRWFFLYCFFSRFRIRMFQFVFYICSLISFTLFPPLVILTCLSLFWRYCSFLVLLTVAPLFSLSPLCPFRLRWRAGAVKEQTQV
jgi:hypothetical protein